MQSVGREKVSHQMKKEKKMSAKSTKSLNRRDPIAFDLLVSGTYRQRVVPNKKKVLKKFDLRKAEF